MRAFGDLMTYMFATHLLVMVGFNVAEDLCSTFVKGVIYGSYSLNELFPQNSTNCTWTLENPDPTKYTIYLKFSKRDHGCSNFSLWAYQFDHYSPEKIRDLLRSTKSVVHLCQARSMFVFLEFDKNFVQLRRLVQSDGRVGPVHGKGQSGRPALEFLVLNKVSPSEFGCQVLCGWLESCLRAEGQVGGVGGGGGKGKGESEAGSCGVMDAKCNCQQDVMTGVDGLDMVLPLNADTEGCLSARLHTTHTCNLTVGKRTPRKESSQNRPSYQRHTAEKRGIKARGSSPCLDAANSKHPEDTSCYECPCFSFAVTEPHMSANTLNRDRQHSCYAMATSRDLCVYKHRAPLPRNSVCAQAQC
ncbi:adhesion G protein-coupled receptor B3-like [Heptranchias perlo]|uniref:adhesion G protein-coupled receptor B3-like n=1 Tax=Heptranchias perlo TaxID=212740 RepID=UPI00355AA83D